MVKTERSIFLLLLITALNLRTFPVQRMFTTLLLLARKMLWWVSITVSISISVSLRAARIYYKMLYLVLQSTLPVLLIYSIWCFVAVLIVVLFWS